MTYRRNEAWKRWWPFALLCLAVSCQWMVTDTYPRAASTLASEAAGCALAAAIAFLAALVKRGAIRVSWLALAGGALVLAGPAADLLLGASLLDPGSVALALTLTAVVVAVGETSLSRDERASTSSLWPGLAAATGMLLVLPAPVFGSLNADAALLLAPLLTGVGCILFRRAAATGGDTSGRWHLFAGLAGGTLVFAAGYGVRSLVERRAYAPAWPAAAVDCVLAMLSMLALRRLTALRYAARFAIVPLLVLWQGLVFLRSIPTWRSVACAGLLAAASWHLLRSVTKDGPAPGAADIS